MSTEFVQGRIIIVLISLLSVAVTLGLILLIIDKWVIRPISVLTQNVINPRTKEDLTKFVSGLTRRVS